MGMEAMIDRRERLGTDNPEDTAVADVQGDGAVRHTNSGSGRLASWFGQWRKPLRGYFSSRTAIPAAEIDDLAQEVFLRLLRYSDDVAVENPQGYLFRIAANVANEWHDRLRVRQRHDQSWLDELRVEPIDEPENALARSRAIESVHAAVDRLPSRQREVLLLHVNEGLTYKQIAERLGLTYRKVLRDLTTAYGQLRMQLNSEDL